MQPLFASPALFLSVSKFMSTLIRAVFSAHFALFAPQKLLVKKKLFVQVAFFFIYRGRNTVKQAFPGV